ncbi:MAG: type 1 glutamine amidotransferase, partial [Rubrimonas sp.]
MRIGVLQTGRVRADLAARFGEYPAMFDAMLARAGGPFSLTTVAVVDGQDLPAPDAMDGWIVTGSRHGVYDGLPWIDPLKAFLRDARAAARPIVGVCFGHQILAEAFGGRVIKHPGGWRLGTHDFAVREGRWAAEAPETLRLHSVHQDQVVELPDDAAVWASAEGCAYAGLLYGDPAAPEAVSIQPHPEFDAAFTRALAEMLVADGKVDAALGEQALSQIGTPVDNARVGRMLAGYLTRAAA